MEENKKEEIKKILQESLSKMNEKKKAQEAEEIQEDIIEEKPPVEEKSESKNNTKKQTKEEDKEKIKKKKEKKIQEEKKAPIEEEIKEKENIKEDPSLNKPSKEDNNSAINITTQEDHSNKLIYGLIGVAIILMLAVIYSFSIKENKDSSTKTSQTNTQNNNQAVISPKPLEEKTTKNLEEKQQEVPQEKQKEKNTFEEKVAVLNQKAILEEKPQQIKKIIKEDDTQLSLKKFKELYNSSEYEKTTCYDYKAGSVISTKECKTQIKNFLLKNKNAIRFEIIAVLGEDDFKTFETLKSSEKVKEFIYRGLGRQRVLEITWNIKEILGEDIIITPTNYYVKSQKNNRGFLLKAYIKK